MNENEMLLRQAIEGRQPVRCVYEGRERLLCPHVLGRKEGRLQALCYQYDGQSSSGRIVTPSDPGNGPPNLWRCMVVAEMRNLEVLPPGPWYTCQRHTQRQTCVGQVLVEVTRD